MQRHEDYIDKHEGGLITSIKNDTDSRLTITRKRKWKEKPLYVRYKRLINNISHEKTWTWLRKENFKRKTESFQIAAQKNAMRTNQIRARIDWTQQNTKCRLYCNRDETIKYIISECSKLAKKNYKTRQFVWARWSTASFARN